MRQSVLVRVNPNEDERRRKAVEMRTVSEVLEGLLAGCGMHDRTVGAAMVEGMDALPIGVGAASVKGPDPKARPVYREVMRQRRPGGTKVGFDYVVHVNHAVPTSTRQAARKSTASLVLVK